MTDILERLQAEERQHRSGFPGMRRDVADLLLEAADEIERLRSEVKALQENPAILSSREPVTFVSCDDLSNEAYHRNITHNLTDMAEAAGLYKILWRPDEVGIDRASQLIEPLAAGLCRLRAKPREFAKYNPENGWGDYDGLVAFVADYLKACIDFPEATVRVSR